MIWLDHVVRVVPDFAATERRFRDDFGLEASRWEVFPDSGVASRIFLFGTSGLELMGIRDAAEAARHPFGCLVSAAVREGERWQGIAVGTDELDAHARRLRLQPMTVPSIGSNGERSTFRLLGNPLTNAVPLPFFIEWPSGSEPWRREHAALNRGIAAVKRVDVAGDAAAVAEHLGGRFDFIAVVGGPPEIRAVILERDGVEIRVE